MKEAPEKQQIAYLMRESVIDKKQLKLLVRFYDGPFSRGIRGGKMKKIIKSAEIILTQEEIDSPNPIEIKLAVKLKGTDESIDYTIKYPK